MSHWPGSRLEDFVSDQWRVVVSDGSSDSWRYNYSGQKILSPEQFKNLVALFEPIRDYVERRLDDYSEEESGSWRDYADFAFDIPKEISEQADKMLASLNVPETKGLFG